jgi:Mlc titration factor MtfA (ptsG expression regulator)
MDVIVFGILAIIGLAFALLVVASGYLMVTNVAYQLVDLTETASLLLGISKPWKLSFKLLHLPPSLAQKLRSLPYYQQLSPAMQRRFESRMVRSMQKLQVVGEAGLVVTDEMRFKIAAGLIKLTFGYRKYIIDGFTTVVLYPGPYRSAHTGQLHKGETQTVGVVKFSWPDLAAGYANTSDNLHLSLHEWSHALWLGLQMNRSADNRLQINHVAWDQLIANSSRIQRWKKAGYLRPYAFTNHMELLACAIESFFESPAQMAQIHPEMYIALVRLLNQDYPHIKLKTPTLRAGVHLKPYRL